MSNKTKTQKVTFAITLVFFIAALITFAKNFYNHNIFVNWKPKETIKFSTEVREVVSKKGIKAWLMEDKTTSIIAAYIIFNGGSACDDEDKNGLSYLVSGLLDEGAGDLTSKEFNEILEQKAIGLSFDNDRVSFSASLVTPKSDKETAFDMLSLALTKPRFDDEPINRMKDVIKVSINKRMESPSYMASWEWRKKAFPDHPFSRQNPADIASIDRITKKDLKNFMKTRIAKDNIFIGVAGNITPDELKELLDKTFSDLPEKSDIKEIPKAQITNFASPVVVDMPIPQSYAIFANKGLTRKDKDFYPAYVMNYILGGGSFSSRLMEEVRSKQGLAYSVSTSLSTSKYAPKITGNVATSNKDFYKSMETINLEWQKMYDKGITDKELKDAKNFLISSFPLRFDSSSSIASILAVMQFKDLGIDFLTSRNSYVEKVTKEDVNRVAKRLLANKPLFVVAGKPVLENN